MEEDVVDLNHRTFSSNHDGLLGLQDEYGCDGVKGMTGQGDVDAGPGLRDLEGLSGLVSEQVCTSNLARNLVEVEAALRPSKEFDVYLVGTGRGAPVPCGDKLRLAFL